MGEDFLVGLVVLEVWAGVDQIPADLVDLAEAKAAAAAGRVIGKRAFKIAQCYAPHAPFCHT